MRALCLACQPKYSRYLCGSSGKLRPFWASLAEKEEIPVLDFLFSVLEYDVTPKSDGDINPHYTAALQRALAIKHCKVSTASSGCRG